MIAEERSWETGIEYVTGFESVAFNVLRVQNVHNCVVGSESRPPLELKDASIGSQNWPEVGSFRH